jgi:hypothetical protein
MTGHGQFLEGLGVPPRKASGSRFPLQLRALITGLAGFPLQSLTRNIAHKVGRGYFTFDAIPVIVGLGH